MNMTDAERDQGESYEQRMQRLQELEEQLARERAELAQMGSQSHSMAPPPNQPSSLPDISSIPTSEPPRSFLASDNFDDLRGNDTSYGDNLLLPDDESPISPDPVNPSTSMNPDLPTFSDEDISGLDQGPLTDAGNEAIPEMRTAEPESEAPFNPVPDEPLSEIDQYRHEIEDFRTRGYNVSRMYNIFTQDIETIRAAVLHYMQDINQLKELESQLEGLDTSGFEHDVLSLNTLMKDPDSVEKAQTFFAELKDTMAHREEKERSRSVQEIEDLFDGVMREFSDVTANFEEIIGDVKVSIIDLETAAISESHHVKKMVYGLKDDLIKARLSQERAGEIKDIKEDLREWARKGFNVTDIEDVVSRDLKIAADLYEEFTSRANKLLELENVVNSIRAKGFESEISEIKKILRDTDKLLLVQNKITSLKRRIRLAGIQTKMDRIRAPLDAKRTGPTQMGCPKCKGTVPIPSDDRPLKVTCSSCHTEYHLKRVPSSEDKGKRVPSSPGQTPPPPKADEPITVQPITVQPITVQPISDAGQGPGTGQPGQDVCPKCRSPLLPDSVFCGLCGHRMD